MTINNTSEAAKAVVRRNTEEVQGGGNFEVFDELFADDFLDHTPQPGRTPDKDGARQLYKILRTVPDFHAEIHWQLADGDRVTSTRPTTGRTGENSWARHRPAVRFSSRPLMSCACATARSLRKRRKSPVAGRLGWVRSSTSIASP